MKNCKKTKMGKNKCWNINIAAGPAMAKVTPAMLLNHYHFLDKLGRRNAVMIYPLLRNKTKFQLKDCEKTTGIPLEILEHHQSTNCAYITIC